MPCDIELSGEAEGCGHWSWAASIYMGGRVKHHTVMLSFSDYDFWSRGTMPPGLVAEKALHFAYDRDGKPALPPSFDLARLRVVLPGVDEWMRGKAR